MRPKCGQLSWVASPSRIVARLSNSCRSPGGRSSAPLAGPRSAAGITGIGRSLTRLWGKHACRTLLQAVRVLFADVMSGCWGGVRLSRRWCLWRPGLKGGVSPPGLDRGGRGAGCSAERGSPRPRGPSPRGPSPRGPGRCGGMDERWIGPSGVRVPAELYQVRDQALEGEAVAVGEPAPGGVEHERRASRPTGWQEHLHHGPHAERLADLGVQSPVAELAIADEVGDRQRPPEPFALGQRASIPCAAGKRVVVPDLRVRDPDP